MAPDVGLLGAIVSEVVRSSEPGTKVLFTMRGTPCSAQQNIASDVAARAGLAEWTGWALVSIDAEPALSAALDDLAETGKSPGAVLVSLDGEGVAVPVGHGEGLDVAVLEMGR